MLNAPFTALQDLVLPAATARLLLLANHVLASAPVATERLKPHAGRILRVDTEGWPWPLLPPPPALVLRVTPAGLLEAAEDAEAPADLRLTLDSSDPLDTAKRLARHEMPAVKIEGDAAFAAEVSWLMANLRWDIAADLERFFGPMAAQGLAQAGERMAGAASQLAQAAAGLMRKP
jgi:ubiquinone biosynthesis protein UbiJ